MNRKPDRNPLLIYRRLAQAIVGVVNQTPRGAALEPMFMVARPYINRLEFEQMMRLLVETRQIRLLGDRYFPVTQ